MRSRAAEKRTFVQIFYLAVQDKGYYVLNDIFRYMPDGVAYGDSLAEGAAPADAAQPNGYAAPPQIADGTVQQMAQVLRPCCCARHRCHSWRITISAVLPSPVPQLSLHSHLLALSQLQTKAAKLQIQGSLTCTLRRSDSCLRRLQGRCKH